jgi:kynureninase
LTDFVATKARFHLPKGVIYLDGNSLGPLPEGAMHRAQQTIESEWGEMLIRAWNLAGWMDQPRRVGDKIVPLIGAEPGTVVMGDTLSIKMYQALAAALAMRPDRKIVLSDTGNFPTDLYMAKGLIDSLARGHVLKTVAPEAVEDAIDDSVAALMLTHIDYGSGRVHDMARLTEKAHAAGALAIWDLAHSAGATPVDLPVVGRTSPRAAPTNISMAGRVRQLSSTCGLTISTRLNPPFPAGSAMRPRSILRSITVRRGGLSGCG